MTAEDISDWLLGIDCPLVCGRRIFGWRSHNCAKLAGKTSAEQVQIATDLARTVLVDMPADKDVHGAYMALDELDGAFPRNPNDKA